VVEADLVDLLEGGIGGDSHVLLAEEFGDGLVEPVMRAVLEMHAQISEFGDRIVEASGHIDTVRVDDAVLGQGAGLIDTQHVQRAQILNRVKAADDHPLPREAGSAAGQAGGHDHRQHLRGQTNRDRDGEHRRLRPVPGDNAVDRQHDRRHHQHEPNQGPADRADAAVETRLRT
jgi:hypothetical protein